MMISSAPASPDDLGLVVGTGDGDHARLHALGDLDLVQAEPAARAGDQHGLARLGLRDAERRAHAGADRADRERRGGQVEAVRHADRVARRHAGEFGVAAAAVLAEHAAVAAEVLPAAEAIAAVAAEQPLIEHHALADALGRDVRASLDDLARDLMAEDAARLAPESCRRARARRDSRCRRRECAPARRPAPACGRSTSVACRTVRTAEFAERDGFHQGHEFNFLREVSATARSRAAGEGRGAFLVVVLGLDECPRGFDFGALSAAVRRRANVASRLVACTAAGE